MLVKHCEIYKQVKEEFQAFFSSCKENDDINQLLHYKGEYVWRARHKWLVNGAVKCEKHTWHSPEYLLSLKLSILQRFNLWTRWTRFSYIKWEQHRCLVRQKGASGKWGGENGRREEEREQGQKEGEDGEGSLLWWLIQPQYGIAGLKTGRGNPKHFWPPSINWLLAYPAKACQFLQRCLPNALPALGEWLVSNLENSYLKGFYLNSCAWFFHGEQGKWNTLYAVICRFNKLLKGI